MYPSNKEQHPTPPNPSLSSRDNTRNLTHSLTYFEHNPPKPHSCFHLPPGWHLPPPPIRNNTTQPPRVEDTPYPQPTSIPQNPPRLPACCTQPKPNQTTIPGSGNRKEENHANKGQIHLFRGADRDIHNPLRHREACVSGQGGPTSQGFLLCLRWKDAC